MREATQLDKVISRVEKLVEKQKVLEAENTKLKGQNDKLKSELKETTGALSETRERLQAIKLGSTVDDSTERRALKARINEYIKEIDRCIQYLNK